MTRRWRRRAKWAGTAACVLTIAVWFASRWWWLTASFAYSNRISSVVVASGQLSCGDGLTVYFSTTRLARGHVYVCDADRREWDWRPWPSIGWPLVKNQVAHIRLPLLVPILLFAAPTAFLWRLDRRRMPGACVRCGYDLTGTPGGVCPECGAGP